MTDWQPMCVAERRRGISSSMRRAGWLLVLVRLTASAQFQNLVTTGDGQQLYFSSPLRLRGTDQFDSPKIFRYLGNTGSFELVAEVQQQQFQAGLKTNLFQLTQPDISADGSILVYTANGLCFGGSACVGYVSSVGQITGASVSGDLLQAETVRISRDGQYALAFGAQTELIQLATGQTLTLNADPRVDARPRPMGDGYEALADGGVVLLTDGQGPLLLRGGTMTRPLFSKPPVLARMSRDASRIVYETFETGQPYQLIAYDVVHASETVLAQGPVAAPVSGSGSAFPYFLPWLTDDGLQAIYLAAPSAGQPKQVYLVSTGTGTLRKLTDIPEGVSSAVISGLGGVVYAATPSNRLFEADTAVGTLRQLTNRTPQVVAWEGGAAPGSLISLQGVALSRTDGTAAVRIGGLDAPTLDFSPESGSFQIPWELALPAPTAVMPLSVGAESDSLIEQVFSVTVAEVEPFFLTLPVTGANAERQAVIAHQDFHGLVTAADPALPGEVLHFYMTGLGPVSPPIRTGQVAPVNSLYVSSTPPMCSFVERTATPVTLLFAGLAPGLLGIYQLDVQVPPNLTTANPQFQCSAHTGDFGIAYDVASVPLRPCSRLRRPAKRRGRQCEVPGVVLMGK